jgi:hypothetical protein
VRVGRPERPVKQPAGGRGNQSPATPSRQAPPTEGGRGRPFSGSAYGPTFSVPAGPPAASAGQRLVPQELVHEPRITRAVAMVLTDYRLILVMTLFRA